MNAKQTEEAKRALRMMGFARGRVTDFTHTPAKSVDTKHAATIAKLETEIADLGGSEAIQQSNEFGEQQSDRRTVEANA